MKEDFYEKLKQKFETLDWPCEDEDMKRLSRNMEYLEQYGLSQINDRLLNENKKPKFLETLTEVNFSAGLIKINRNICSGDISYELSRGVHRNRPIDLEILLNSVTYLIQIKSPSKGEYRNRQDNLMKDINGVRQ